MSHRRRNHWIAGSVLSILFMASCTLSRSTAVTSGTSVKAIAKAVDQLERLIETYGSVTVKQPDVWGQARLTRHREEYEAQMAAELPNFMFSLQGSIAGSDQAYLADAAALSAAASGSQATVQRPRSGGSSTSTTTNAFTILPGTLSSPSSLVHTDTVPAGGAPSPSVINPQALPNPNDTGTFAAFNNVSRSPSTLPSPLSFAGAKNGISLEPPLLLDQKSQYLNHLHELRRINEGDDTADSPGYALNLVRFPISIMPGKKTDIGYGAEVTMTLRPYLSDELLPTTFRNLVLNDLLEQMSFPVTQFINDPQNAVYLDTRSAEDIRELFAWLDDVTSFTDAAGQEPWQLEIAVTVLMDALKEHRWTPSLEKIFARPEWTWVDKYLDEWSQVESDNEPIDQEKKGALIANKLVLIKKLISTVEEQLRWHVPKSKSRRAQMPFPPEQMIPIYGFHTFYLMCKDTYDTLAKERFSRPASDQVYVVIHLPDVQGFLKEKVAAAYELLKQDTQLVKWDSYCAPDFGLTRAIREDARGLISERRKAFTDELKATANPTCKALAWAVIVESALLNDRLKEDIRVAANLKGEITLDPTCTNFYGPNPTPEARQIFNQYVQCRWPIHVFALDPTGREQNLQSTFSTRREMQLALSLAFINGRLSANNMMRYARRIEFDFATIDLNGTAVGFSHGENTFGWRMYPRFQTPDIECNTKVLMRDLVLGGPNRNALLKQRRLEPGIRECTAIVIMPSFVPYATLSTSTNWFSLTDPRKKELNSSDAMKLSQQVKDLETSGSCAIDSDCYRDGDLARLMEKAQQLESRLPLQTTQVQIPYENTLGGFSMFNTGVTELAPELTGWYGTSSINPNAATTLFLAGDHFSVHQTAVIAGGQLVSNQKLLSRQVMQVTIPQNPILVGDAAEKFVDVQLATPYGVTQHLLIPAVVPPKPDDSQAAPQSVAWSPSTLTLGFSYAATGIVPASAGSTKPPAAVYKPSVLLIQPGDINPSDYGDAEVTLKFDKRYVIDKSATVKATAKYDTDRKAYTVAMDQLTSGIYLAFGGVFGPEDTNPPNPLTASATVVFKPKTNLPTVSRSTANGLTIQWIKSPQGGGGGKAAAAE